MSIRNFILTILFIVLLASTTRCFADPVSVGDVLSKAGAKEGILFDMKHQHGLNFLAATIAEKGAFSLVGGLVATDGIGLAVDYDIGTTLPKVNFPVLSLVNYLHVGVGGYCRTLTVHTDTVENSKNDNKWGWGPTVFVKWSF